MPVGVHLPVFSLARQHAGVRNIEVNERAKVHTSGSLLTVIADKSGLEGDTRLVG